MSERSIRPSSGHPASDLSSAESTRTFRRDRRNVAVQQGNAYPGVIDYLVDELGFERLQLTDRGASIRGKLALLWGMLRSLVDLLGRLRSIGRLDTVIAIGHFAIVLKLLARLGLLHYGRLYCFAFFIHSPLSFLIYRLVTRMDGALDHYIVFSEWDADLYARKLGIDRGRLHYLPYGDWAPEPPQMDDEAPPGAPSNDYYFAGGYTNRDYLALINAFRVIPASLIIVCSSLNREVSDASLPPNVRVLRDLPEDAFESYVRHARACIIPLKRDTGASGQSVMLRLMRNGKIIIASDVGAIRGYVANGVSGFLVRDIARELPEVIAEIERDPAAAARVARAAHERYRGSFSRPAVRAALRRIVDLRSIPGAE
jgi:glycosyltransferase involved in cell wall biosynthesis